MDTFKKLFAEVGERIEAFKTSFKAEAVKASAEPATAPVEVKAEAEPVVQAEAPAPDAAPADAPKDAVVSVDDFNSVKDEVSNLSKQVAEIMQILSDMNMANQKLSSELETFAKQPAGEAINTNDDVIEFKKNTPTGNPLFDRLNKKIQEARKN